MVITEASFTPEYQRAKICSNENGNYTVNSTYHSNLKTLLSTLTSHTEINYGFYNFSYGQNTDKVYAIGLCRGDVEPDECRTCLNYSRLILTQFCPNQKEAIKWEAKCMLRYSNRPIFRTMETDPPFRMNNLNNATDVDEFNKVLGELVRSLRGKAASGDSRRKYDSGNAVAANFQTIYGLVQCTPDLSSQDCGDCLDWTISEIPRNFKDKVGVVLLKPSCNVRFEIYPFFDHTTILDPVVPPVSPSPKEKDNSLRITITVVVTIFLVLLVVLLIVISRYFGRKQARKNLLPDEDEHDEEIQMVESLQFDLDTIQVATNNFSDSNKLGEGGFGTVYQGLLSNGQGIAVKRLSSNSGQGDMEFKNEVLLLAKLQHRNLVRLLGFSLAGREKLLVYEFVPNKSLDYFIFNPTKKAQLDWERRYKIIRGVARGLLYLHEDSRLRIIHRDLKASNVLLDEEMIPKISDFGMARLIVADQTQENTSRVVGTYGYMAPEYVMHGQFSVKSDVFSFGVLVLEIVSGQKNHDTRHENGEDLINFAWKKWQEGTITNIIDPSLINNLQNEMIRCIHIGLLCVQENLSNRPTMANIALMLNSCSITLPVPSKPAFFMDSAATSLPNMSWGVNSGTTISSQSTTKSIQESANEASITELYPR
uniref:Cysteine-rich receptor-like protein kinase 29 n=2 Tax=Cajanus cajan TaxID=3821 RepID=A0A151TB35_CAJCA|nr:Cysteine-rich receptor-like protein kinase 29 [Cajanus cajan]